jgi:poly-gamma-glutamate synthesis protein (capsule biosynthesis protein)
VHVVFLASLGSASQNTGMPGDRSRAGDRREYRFLLAALVAVISLPVSRPFSDPIDDQATLLFTGDILVHTPVTASASRYGRSSGSPFDFSPMFAEVAPVISASDWAVCHLEVPIGVPGVVSSPFPRIAAPAEVAQGLAGAGFDSCSTASNHALDYGPAGVGATLGALDEAGVAHTGTATGPGDANGVLYQVGDLVIGHASYAYGFNGFSVPPDQPWLANLIEPERILADAARLRRVGADFVVVSLHWGSEYRIDPISFQTDLASQLLEEGSIDLIIGHHAHVVQPVTRLGGVPVLFGLGNFLSNQTNQRSEDGVMVIVRLARFSGRWMVEELVAVPTWVDRRQGHVIRDALRSEGGSRPPAASASRTGEALSLLGEQVPLYSVEEARLWVLAPTLATRADHLCARGAC